MKKTIPFLLKISLFAGFFVGVSAHAQLKVGTIDMKSLFDNYSKTKEEERVIGEARAQAKKEVDERIAALKSAEADLRKLQEEANKKELSPSAKAEKGKQLNEKVKAFSEKQREVQEFQQTRQRQLTEQAMRSRNQIVEEINKVISERVRVAGYDLVLDKSGTSLNSVGVLVYSKDSFDFTAAVAAELNKMASAAAADANKGKPKAKSEKK
jgi:Skp family chaperone for outer membrane proteins